MTDKIVESMSETEDEPLNTTDSAFNVEKQNQSVNETLFKKLLKRKWWLFGIILVLVIGVTVGTSIYCTRTRASTSSLNTIRDTRKKLFFC